jgi:hypothetical protein
LWLHNSKGKFHMKRLLLVLFATAAPVHAAEITVQRDAVLSTVMIDGVIELPDYPDFVAATRGLGKALVKLRSIGGKIIAAMQIGQKVRDRQMEHASSRFVPERLQSDLGSGDRALSAAWQFSRFSSAQG